MNRITSGLIEFSYRTTDLLDRVQMYTQYPVRTMENKSDEFMVTDDETTLVYAELDQAFSEVFQTAYKLSYGVVDSLYLNTSVVFGTETYTGYGFKLIDRRGYNANLIPMVDQYIQRLVVAHVNANWYRLTGNKLFEAEQMIIADLTMKYTASLMELYKPKLDYTEITPQVVDVVISVDPDTDVVTEETDSTIDDTVNEIVYKDTYSEFPSPGVEDIMYIARDTGVQYYWNGTAYVAYNVTTTYYSVDITAQTSLTFTHNLNKLMLHVIITDGDGVEWEVDYTPIDANSGTATWTNLRTGTLYAY